MTVLFLWSQLADYSVACMKEFSSYKDIKLHLIYQPVGSEAPFEKFELSFCKSITIYSKAKSKEIIESCTKLKPDYIVMSSWNYSSYMYIAKQCRKSGTYVI